MKCSIIKLSVVLFFCSTHFAFAGNTLKDSCAQYVSNGEYISGLTVKLISVISSWDGSGPGLNITFNNDLSYGIAYDGAGRSDMYDIAKTSYLYKSKVNLCYRSGQIKGIELAR